MAAFFNLHIPPVGMSLGAAMLPIGRRARALQIALPQRRPGWQQRVANSAYSLECSSELRFCWW